MFMASKDNGWYEHTSLLSGANEGSKGEGLSRFLAFQFTLAKGIAARYRDFEVVPLWLNTPTRPNYVDDNPDDINPDTVTGCTACFLYYLHSQLGYPISSIIDAGAPTLGEVYQKLTGRTDGWQSFIDLTNRHYPPGTAYNTAGDNIFPVPNLSWLDNTVKLVSGASGVISVSVDEDTPVDVDISFASDDPGFVRVPATARIAVGRRDTSVALQAEPVVGPERSVTIHASYAGQTVSAPVWVLPRPSIIDGVITDTASNPLAGAVVVIDGSDPAQPQHLQLLTGSDGSYETPPVPPDTYTIEVTASGYVPAYTSTVVHEGVPTTAVDVALELTRPFTIRGTVSEPGQGPVAEAAVSVVQNGLDQRRASTITDSAGDYDLTMDPGPYTGDYTLTATHPGYTVATEVLTIPNGSTLDENLVLAKLCSLTGLITDTGTTPPAPVVSATVHAGAVTTQSDSGGRYELELAPGPTLVTVDVDGFEHSAVTVAAVAGGALTHDFALVEATATLTGTVSDGSSGNPLHGAFIRVDGGLSGMRTDWDGSYTISRIPAGPTHVTIAAPGYRTEQSPLAVDAHETTTMNYYLAPNHPDPHPPA
jgi:protocatechuate 3,4-dioxygenase beta subunit